MYRISTKRVDGERKVVKAWREHPCFNCVLSEGTPYAERVQEIDD